MHEIDGRSGVKDVCICAAQKTHQMECVPARCRRETTASAIFNATTLAQAMAKSTHMSAGCARARSALQQFPSIAGLN